MAYLILFTFTYQDSVHSNWVIFDINFLQRSVNYRLKLIDMVVGFRIMKNNQEVTDIEKPKARLETMWPNSNHSYIKIHKVLPGSTL